MLCVAELYDCDDEDECECQILTSYYFYFRYFLFTSWYIFVNVSCENWEWWLEYCR